MREKCVYVGEREPTGARRLEVRYAECPRLRMAPLVSVGGWRREAGRVVVAFCR